MTGTPIEDYALLSDRHSAALVSRGGSVDWLCFPRFDSPSLFGALLDDDAGRWSIRPAEAHTVSRAYLDGTLVLQTVFTTDRGSVTVTDALATGPATGPHSLGAAAPHLLIREVTCTAGTVPMSIDVEPRPEYGLITPLLQPCPGGIAGRGGASTSRLSSPVDLHLEAGTATAAVSLHAGQSAAFALHWAPLSGPPPRIFDQTQITGMLHDTITAWRSWSAAHHSYRPLARPCAPQRPDPARPHLPTHRSGHRRGHHLTTHDPFETAEFGREQHA